MSDTLQLGALQLVRHDAAPQDSLKAWDTPVDTSAMAADVAASVRYLLDQLVAGIPGVTGALAATVDGFVIAHRLQLPRDAATVDAAGLAAMSAAMLGISNRMVGAVGPAPVREVTLRSPSGFVTAYRVAHVAVLTVTAAPGVDLDRVHLVARELANGIERLLRGAAVAQQPLDAGARSPEAPSAPGPARRAPSEAPNGAMQHA